MNRPTPVPAVPPQRRLPIAGPAVILAASLLCVACGSSGSGAEGPFTTRRPASLDEANAYILQRPPHATRTPAAAWADRQVEIALDRPVTLEADQQPLEAVISDIAEQTDTRVHVNWGMLSHAGVEPEMPVSIQLQRGVGREALLMVVEQASMFSKEPLAFGVVDGIVVLSTQSHFRLQSQYRGQP